MSVRVCVRVCVWMGGWGCVHVFSQCVCVCLFVCVCVFAGTRMCVCRGMLMYEFLHVCVLGGWVGGLYVYD